MKVDTAGELLKITDKLIALQHDMTEVIKDIQNLIKEELK